MARIRVVIVDGVAAKSRVELEDGTPIEGVVGVRLSLDANHASGFTFATLEIVPAMFEVVAEAERRRLTLQEALDLWKVKLSDG